MRSTNTFECAVLLQVLISSYDFSLCQVEDLIASMDLIDLLEKAPPLLYACTLEDIPTVRQLRLVCKEGSRVGLLGLRTYTLNLNGGPANTNVSGSSLLQRAALQELHVHLCLSGVWSDGTSHLEVQESKLTKVQNSVLVVRQGCGNPCTVL